MKLEKGDNIKTSLSDNTVVLDVEDKRATLFTGTQFVVAGGIDYNEEKGIFEWQGGRYADTIDSLPMAKIDDFSKMKDLLSGLMENSYENYVKAMISIETGIDNEEILQDAYDNYMSDDITGLLDESFARYVEDYSLDKEQDKDREENREAKLQGGQEEKIKEEMTKEDNIAKEPINENEDLLSIVGNLTSDPEISEHTAKAGRNFKVAAFSIANNDKDGQVKYTNCFAYDNKIDKVENLKKGDFVSLFGKKQIAQGKNGKTYENFKIFGVKLLKEKKKESVIGNMNKFKEKSKAEAKEKGIKNTVKETEI
mgnify:FL=1